MPSIEQLRRKLALGSRTAVALLSWCILVLAAFAVAALAARNAVAAEPEIVARVNGEPLTREEFQRMRANPRTLRQLQQELGVDDPGARELDRLALSKLIQLRLMVQEARLKKIAVKEKELDEAIAALRRRFGDLRGFGEWMKEQGLNDRSLFASVRADMLADRARAALVKDVRVTDEQVRQYYETHKDELKIAEVRLQMIVARDPAAAEEALTALRATRDFARVARERSIGRRAAKGGDTGWISSETLWPSLRKLVGTMAVGQTGGPLQNGKEFVIVRLADRRPGRTIALAEARPRIEPYLLAVKQQEAVQEWLVQKEQKARIEILLSDLKPISK